MKLRPLHDRVVVQRVATEEKTASGIIIPENAKEKPVEGRVVVVGNGRVNDKGELIPMEVKEGQNVIFNKYAGIEVNVQGEDVLILRENEILAIVED
jgi:chaperonin GroES